MADNAELIRLDEQGKRDFQAGRYAAAADCFRRAVQAYAALEDRMNEAEQRSNLSVTLLKLRRPQEALEHTAGTDEVFAKAHDKRRHGMALNNQAAALQALGREAEALAAYERAAQSLGQAGEGDLRASALKAAAAIELRQGKLALSGLKMLGALGSSLKPTFLERVLKSLLRLPR